MRRASLLQAFLAFYFSVILIGCSSGGGGSGSDGVESPQLSATSAYPGEYITITHESIQDGQESTVKFSDTGGYSATMKIEPEVDGSVRAGVPVFLGPATGMTETGAVRVEVNGYMAQASFTIRAIPELGSEGGEVYVLFLEKMNAEMETAKAHLEHIMENESIDFLSGAIDTLDARIIQTQAMITQIRTTRTLTVTPVEGTTRTLTTDELKQVDQWLAAWILGLEAEMRSVSPLSSEGLNTEDWLQISPEERLQRIQNGIDYTIDETKRGVKAAGIWLTGVSLAVSAGGYAVMVEVGSDIAGAGGLALTYIQATWELGTTAITEKMTDAFSSEAREAYDWSSDILKQARDIALSWLSTMENHMGKLSEIIDTGKDIHDMVKDAEEVKCRGQDGSFLIPTRAFSGITVTDFCGNEVVLSDFVTASVSIEGYSASFTFSGALATLGTIEDGQGHVLLGSIPSIIGTDGELDFANPIVMVGQDTLLIMIDPVLFGPFPRTISLTEDSLMDGGEAQITFHTPYFLNEDDPNNPVIFTVLGGTMTVEHFGSAVGDLLKGTYSVTVEGERDISEDESETLTGIIMGSFEGVISEPPDT
jgi:hypothetical protein